MNIKYIVFAIVALFSFSCCTGSDPEPEKTTTRTVLIYIAADNGLNSYAYNSLDQTLTGAAGDNLGDGKLLVYFDPKDDVPVLYEISKNSKGVVVKTAVKTYAEQNSVDPTVMQGVINEVMADYPADSYGLVLWSHATAWLPSAYKNYLRSFGQDGTNYMELNDLATTLSPYHFDFILFDCCYMASAEVMYALRNCADYIIASPTETMADSFPYSTIVSSMFTVPADVQGICEKFYNYYNAQSGYNQSATVALVKTSAMDALASATRDILYGKMDTILTLNVGKLQQLEYLTSSVHALYDFRDLVSRVGTASQMTAFDTALNNAVIYKATTPKSTYAYGGGVQLSMNTFCGLSIYVPQTSLSSLNEWYKNLAWYKAVYE